MLPSKRPHPIGLPRLWRDASLIAGLAALLASPSNADVIVDASVTPQAGSFLYDISITNTEAEDLAFVSFFDAPGGDPLIEPSLIVPLGFLASYDGILGFLDFLGDTAVFPAGGTVGGFRFQSLSGPDQSFRMVEAFSVNGTPFAGLVQTTVVPEAGTLGAAAALGGIVVAYGIRRRARSTAITTVSV